MTKINDKTLSLLKKINDVNKSKLAAKVTVAQARVELATLKEKLIVSGNLSDADISFILKDIDCW
jgi:hypothetical protein